MWPYLEIGSLHILFKLRISRWHHPGLRMGTYCYPCKKNSRIAHSGHMNMKVKISYAAISQGTLGTPETGNDDWCSVTLSRLSLRPHGLQQANFLCPSPRPCSNPCPLNQRCHPTILSSVTVFSSCLQSFPHQGLFQWVSSLHQVAKGLEFQLQHQSFQWTFRVDFP